MPIGRYIVDFVCHEKRLIVEADGGKPAENPNDAARDRWLVDAGYRVLRFWNNDILKNSSGVLELILAELSSRSAR